MSQTSRRPSGSLPFWPAGAQIIRREGSGPLGPCPPIVDTSRPHLRRRCPWCKTTLPGWVVWLPNRHRGAAGRPGGRGQCGSISPRVCSPVGTSTWSCHASATPAPSTPATTCSTSSWTRMAPWCARPRTNSCSPWHKGAFDASTATGIEADRAEVEALIAEWEPPFGNGWERFRPGLGWPITFARGLRDLELPLQQRARRNQGPAPCLRRAPKKFLNFFPQTPENGRIRGLNVGGPCLA